MSGITEGGCACGAIRYVFNDQAVFSFHRQCRDCQRASGGGHASSFIVRLECVNLTGEVQYYKRQTASGNVVSQDFCPTCGSPMFNRNSGCPDSLFIHAATLDDPFTFKSQKVVYREEVQSWAARRHDQGLGLGLRETDSLERVAQFLDQIPVGAFKANPLRDISRALGVEDLSATYPDLPSQRENKPALHGIFREAFARNTTDHWLAKLEEQDLLCAPVKSLAEALEDPQTEINDMLRRVDHPVLGEITLVGSPFHLSAARCDKHAQKVFLPVRALAIVALFRI